MESLTKKIIFFLHLNNNTIEKEAIPIYINPITKKSEYPSLLCKMKNKYYKTVYTMYALDLPIENKDKTLSLILQLKSNLNYPFEINIPNNYFEKEESFYFFYLEKIIFKQRLKNGFFDRFLNVKNKDLDPPFSCDINIFEQTQLILGYINNQKRKEQFDVLNGLKNELGFSKFTRLTDLFLIYLKIIFVDNYNIKLIQELLDNYNYINFDIKNSFNFSLFFESAIKPIFLKSYTNTNRNYIIYNNFEYDLRNCLNHKYNKIFDKLCFKYYIFYDKEFLKNEENIKSRILTLKQKNEFFETLHEVLLELNMVNIFNLKKMLLSEEYIQNLIENKNNEMNKIKKNGRNNNIIDVNNFNGLKIYESEHYSIPVYFLGKLNNGCSIRSIDDKELYLYDNILNVKIIVQYQFSHNTTSVFQLQDGNIIIVFSNNKKICILDTNNIYKKLESIYSFDNIYTIDIQDDDEDYVILKVIETQNKNLVILSKNRISFYYNKSNENGKYYNYKKFNEIKAQNYINNFSILEFDDNFIIVCSGKFKLNFSIECYLTFINIKKINENFFCNDYSIHKVNGLVLYYSVFEDNNILFKIREDILGIGGKNIYLYSIKYKEIFQIVVLPTIISEYYYRFVSSFYLEKNQFLYVAVKYFLEKDDLNNFLIKYYIYSFNDDNYLKNKNELIFLLFLSESKSNSQQAFSEATEIQN